MRRVIRCVAACWILSNFAVAEPAPTLSVVGDRFAISNEPKFLVLISYFDALGAPDEILDSDIAHLRTVGVDGLRIFPNWWNWADRSRFADNTLMKGDGTLRAESLAKLKRVLAKAAAHGMIVDVSFAYETVEGLSELRSDQLGVSQTLLPVNQVKLEQYEAGLMAVAKELRPYRNLFIDIQNEYNGRITHLDGEDVKRLAAAIKSVDPARLVTASLANEISADDTAKKSVENGLDIVGWHESRNPWKLDELANAVRGARALAKRPVYLGEPPYVDDEHSVDDFIAGVVNAKAGGAAAWTFHTQHGFELRERSLSDQLTEPEKHFLTTFKASLDRQAWGE